MPAGEQLGLGEQGGVPGDGKRVQKRGSVVFPEFGGKVFETMAGNENDQIFIRHDVIILTTAPGFP